MSGGGGGGQRGVAFDFRLLAAEVRAEEVESEREYEKWHADNIKKKMKAPAKKP